MQKYIYYPHAERSKGVLIIGKGCMISNHHRCIDLTGNVTIGDAVIISEGVHIFTHGHCIKSQEKIDVLALRKLRESIVWYDKTIGSEAWIMTNALILDKCQNIAEGVVIGAGSVVTKSIDKPYSIWAGNPAKFIGDRIEGGNG